MLQEQVQTIAPNVDRDTAKGRVRVQNAVYRQGNDVLKLSLNDWYTFHSRVDGSNDLYLPFLPDFRKLFDSLVVTLALLCMQRERFTDGVASSRLLRFAVDSLPPTTATGRSIPNGITIKHINKTLVVPVG